MRQAGRVIFHHQCYHKVLKQRHSIVSKRKERHFIVSILTASPQRRHVEERDAFCASGLDSDTSSWPVRSESDKCDELFLFVLEYRQKINWFKKGPAEDFK